MAESVWGTLYDNTTIRYQAVQQLIALDDLVAACTLANLIFDKEWEIRASTLRAMSAFAP